MDVVNPKSVIFFNFHQLEVVSRYRDTQLQLSENYPYLFNLRANICKSCRLKTRVKDCTLTLASYLRLTSRYDAKVRVLSEYCRPTLPNPGAGSIKREPV